MLRKMSVLKCEEASPARGVCQRVLSSPSAHDLTDALVDAKEPIVLSAILPSK